MLHDQFSEKTANWKACVDGTSKAKTSHYQSSKLKATCAFKAEQLY